MLGASGRVDQIYYRSTLRFSDKEVVFGFRAASKSKGLSIRGDGSYYPTSNLFIPSPFPIFSRDSRYASYLPFVSWVNPQCYFVSKTQPGFFDSLFSFLRWFSR